MPHMKLTRTAVAALQEVLGFVSRAYDELVQFDELHSSYSSWADVAWQRSALAFLQVWGSEQQHAPLSSSQAQLLLECSPGAMVIMCTSRAAACECFCLTW